MEANNTTDTLTPLACYRFAVYWLLLLRAVKINCSKQYQFDSYIDHGIEKNAVRYTHFVHLLCAFVTLTTSSLDLHNVIYIVNLLILSYYWVDPCTCLNSVARPVHGLARFFFALHSPACCLPGPARLCFPHRGPARPGPPIYALRQIPITIANVIVK